MSRVSCMYLKWIVEEKQDFLNKRGKKRKKRKESKTSSRIAGVNCQGCRMRLDVSSGRDREDNCTTTNGLYYLYILFCYTISLVYISSYYSYKI